MNELFPHLKGLAGGKKQAWINSNLDHIAMLNEMLGFEETCKALYMKADTLVTALKKAERYHRPEITEANKAFNLAERANNKADNIWKELSIQAEIIKKQLEDNENLRDILTLYFETMANNNLLMAKLCKATQTYFTEHIDRANKRKVGPTRHASRSRLLISRDRQGDQPHRSRSRQSHSKTKRTFHARKGAYRG